jgi:glycosyltransferase involved in cell wall biosynthesis
MHVLFIHQAFPAQFGQLGLELTKRYGWKCSYIIQNLSRCPTPSPEMLQLLELHQLNLPAAHLSRDLIPWSQSYTHYLDLSQAVLEAVQCRPGLRPDLVVSHEGLGPAFFLPEVLRCPIINYCEFYFAPEHSDISYRIDLPPAETAGFYPRCINAATLVGLLNCAGGYSPTHWQRRSFPQRFWPKIEVHFDGLDTDLYSPGRPAPETAARLLGGRSLPAGTRVVTFVARGLESMRGFDLFMRLARRLAQVRSDVLFVVVGMDHSFYSWDRLHVQQQNFREWVLSQDTYDLSRFIFHHHLEPADLADLLRLSDLHVYLTVPFVPSWSLFNALSCGCVVLASDVDPVREIIDAGVHGLLEPLYDTERQLETALRVLDEPAAFRPLGTAARQRMEERYSLEVTVPALHDYFARMAAGQHRDGPALSAESI